MMNSRLRHVLRKFAQAFRAVWRVRPFSGIYAHVRDVPAKGNGFTDDRWIRATLDHTERVARELEHAPAPRFNAAEVVTLPLLASLVYAERKRVSILDVGGACGVAYLQVRQVVPAAAIDYHLVENTDVLRAARQSSYLPADAHLHESLPDRSIRPDIIHAASVIQYIEDYRTFLLSLAGYGARYVLLANSPIGDVPTSATAQVNVPPDVLPYWFLNIEEIRGILEEAGYELVFSSLCERDYDLGNLPAAYRSHSPRNLLFVRRSRP